MTELDEARAANGVGLGDPWPPTEGDASSVADRAEGEPQIGEEEDGQLFVLEEDQRVSLGSLIKRNVPVEYEVNLRGKSVKGHGNMGLIGFANPDLILIVPVRAGKVEVDPTYEADGAVKKVKIRANLKPSTVYEASSEAGQALLRGL